MRALRLIEWRSDPVLVEVDEPVAGPGQVVVRVGAAGACHSDLHLTRDFDEGRVPWRPPFTLGHENAGWVHALGAGVTGFEVGQPVAVCGAWGCGACERCLVGVEAYCEDVDAAPVRGGGAGLGLDGGMAELMLVDSPRHLVPLPDGLDPVAAAPLTDAGLTPYHAIRRSWQKLVPGSTAVVLGVGGLGHLAVQILSVATAARIVAVDQRPRALETAAACGADVVVPAGEGPAGIRAAAGGRRADVVLDFVGSDETLRTAGAVARSLGDVTVVGLAGGSLPVSVRFPRYEVSVQTTYWGSRPELVEVLRLAARGLLRAHVTTFPLDRAADAYRLLAAGQVDGRAVVVPGSG